MNTFLFTWNPEKWSWTDFEQNIVELKEKGNVKHRWSCASYKSINVADRFFLIKLGRGKRGIIGSGYVDSSPSFAKHWNGSEKMTPYVILDFEVLLNPDENSILPIDLLKQGKLNVQQWSPQTSGISIRKEITEELESIWFNFLATEKINFNPFKNSNNEDQKAYIEGKSNQVYLTKYERNPHARKKCIEHFGLSCLVCQLNFEKIYGEIGKDFIHVHHVNKISTIGKTYQVNPIKDLIPVCPNCHAMIHKREIPYNLDEIREIYLYNKAKT